MSLKQNQASSKKHWAGQPMRFSCKCSLTSATTGGLILAVSRQQLYCTSWTRAVSCRQLWKAGKRQQIRCRFLLARAPPSMSLLIFSDHTLICMSDAFTHEKSSEHSCVLFWRRVPWGFCLLFIPPSFSQSFDFSCRISLWEVTLNVVGQTMWWKQNVMRRGRL